MRLKCFLLLTLFTFVLLSVGCGRFLAERLAQAPNTYPDWIKRTMPVYLDVGSKVLTNFPARFIEVGPPAARLRYRVVEPRDYGLSFSSTHWQERGKTWFKFTFRQKLPGTPTPYTQAPRGTVVLLHGYSLDQGRMVPWAFRLAQEGWRCVLLDLRGHGKSTGNRIHFGLVETRDLSQLLDELARSGQLTEPVAAVGESYGGALALRWKSEEPRVRSVVAITPYTELPQAVLNMRKYNASFVPAFLVKAGLNHLPEVLQANAAELNLTTVLRRTPVPALFVAGAEDAIAPPENVRRLHALAAETSRLLIVPQATHEALPYFFNDLAQPVISWLEQAATTAGRHEAHDDTARSNSK
ncbi:MAG: alpha/beta fold hydrolase [Verrucomicrobia bacterium]|nr:alpha/beta fold hydrolase [Verrucomicrobiota bacterium]